MSSYAISSDELKELVGHGFKVTSVTLEHDGGVIIKSPLGWSFGWHRMWCFPDDMETGIAWLKAMRTPQVMTSDKARMTYQLFNHQGSQSTPDRDVWANSRWVITTHHAARFITMADRLTAEMHHERSLTPLLDIVEEVAARDFRKPVSRTRNKA